jgi:asparagine synthase (glutamine-hydrolysing)
MCGIAGLLNFDGRPVDVSLLDRMTDLLRHRGPDDRGVVADGPIGLGMRRLSIIDLEGGAQPISGEDGSVRIVFNGEIYNHRALREELEKRGHRFRTRADTEVIVHGYEEYGAGVLDRLNGIFAFAVWDEGRGRLLLARDRLGVKPLYYARTASGIAFASELKSLRPVPGIGWDFDAAALQQYLAWEFIPSPRTPFERISKLPPATLMVADRAGRITRKVYWSVKPGPPPRSPREAEEELLAHLDRSVSMQREADVPVGAFLSGGIDSSGVVASLAASRRDPVHTFSIGFAEDAFSETAHARVVARRFGTVHEEEVLRPDCAALVESIADYLDEPFGDASVLPTYLVSRLARRHVKVVLSGDGADELFAGYDRYKASRVASWYALLPAALRARLARAPGSQAPDPARRDTLRARLRRLEAGLALDPALEHVRFMVRGLGTLHGDLLAGRDGDGAWAEPYARAFAASPFGPGITRQLHVDLGTYLADDILFKVDRASMATSLEARVPYLDHELVEFAFRIPGRWKLRGLTGKWILRRALGRRLPAATLRRRKAGFSVPVAAWLRDGLRPLASDLLGAARLRRQGLFEPRRVTALLDEHLSGRADRSRLLWMLIMFQLWSERYARPDAGAIAGAAAGVHPETAWCGPAAVPAGRN